MNARIFCVWLSLPVLALALAAAPPPPEVEVVQPVAREVADYEHFIGRLEPSATVQLKARVTGYLDKVLFKEGAEVKKGDLLFEIDPSPYKTELKKAEAAVVVGQAGLARAEADLKRARTLFETRLIGKDELDKLVAAREEAQARLQLARAERDIASLHLGFTRVTAPISGRIGRPLLDAGNLVKADETSLATLVSQDPLHVSFAVDERTALRLPRGKGKGLQAAVSLAGEEGFPRRAEVSYVDVHVDPKTGTLRLRAALPNADGTLVPGLSARVRLTTGKPHKALLVPEWAVERNLNKVGRTSGPGVGLVLVVSGKNTVEMREVRLGQGHGGLVVVQDGLRAGDWVVHSWSAGLKEGALVRPKKVAGAGAP